MPSIAARAFNRRWKSDGTFRICTIVLNMISLYFHRFIIVNAPARQSTEPVVPYQQESPPSGRALVDLRRLETPSVSFSASSALSSSMCPSTFAPSFCWLRASLLNISGYAALTFSGQHPDVLRFDPDRYALMNASRSALICSLWVEHRPCGAPGWIFSVDPLTILAASKAEAPIGTI